MPDITNLGLVSDIKAIFFPVCTWGVIKYNNLALRSIQLKVLLNLITKTSTLDTKGRHTKDK